jgi:hypothetical protein
MKILFILFFSFFIMLLASCSDSPTNNTPPKELFPMTVGNRWVYTKTDSSGKETTHVNEVKKDTILFNNEKWYIMTYDTNTRLFCKNTAEGLWFAYFDAINQNGIAVLTYKYPASAGIQYSINNNGIVKLVSTNSKDLTFNEPVNDVHLYNIFYSISEQYNEYYIPDKGLVYIEKYSMETGQKVVLESTSLKTYLLL